MTLVHRRERGLEREQQTTPVWIRRCLSQTGPLRLRSIDSKSLLIHTTLFPAHPKPIHATALVDSGCSARAFADRKMVEAAGIPTFPTPQRRALLLADGKKAGVIERYFISPVSVGTHREKCLFFLTDLSPDTPVIFGLPWLQRHNPTIDWTHMTLTFTSRYCQRHCYSDRTGKPPTALVLPDPQKGFHDLPIPGEPRKPGQHHPPAAWGIPEDTTTARKTKVIPYPSTALAKTPTGYRSPTVEDAPDKSDESDKPKSSSMTSTVEWKPDNSMASNQPDLEDIKILKAPDFAQFCRMLGVRTMVVTWDELQGWVPGTSHLSRIDELQAGEPQQHYRLSKITDEDIDKFLKGKPQATRDEVRNKLPEWLKEQVEAFLPKSAGELPPRRAWDHKIDLQPGKEPPYIKNRPLSPRELEAVRKWLDDNLEKGFIRESQARCAAPLTLAAKPGGGIRICQDYRGLNNITIKNRYPLPLIRETLDALCHAKVYTKLDVVAAFNKLRIAEGHEWKTAFITRFGLFESLVMPFGLCNAPASFQNYINHVLFDLLDNTCTAYLDDVLIYSSDKKEHRKHVDEVVSRLREAGLQIDIDKCEFETTKTKYLGLIITPGGIQMDPDKVSAILNWERPSGLHDLQRFLGFANFYRRFIQDFSKMTRPLNDLLRKDTTWCWTEGHQLAFDRLKIAFTTAPILAFYDHTKRTVLETDASDWASGGILSQFDDTGTLRPVAYYSSKHTAQECNYEIYDKELLAIIKCLEEWRPELQGTGEAFEVITDHKNLEYFTTTKALNQRQVRWSEFLSQFNFQIKYRPGTKAVRPDALSRKSQDRPDKADIHDDRIKNRHRTMLPPSRFRVEGRNDAAVTAAPIDVILPGDDKPIDDLIDNAYATDEMTKAMVHALKDPTTRHWPSKWKKLIRIAMSDCKLLGDRIYYRERLFVPASDELRTQIIYRTHSTGPAGHPGRVKTLDLVNRSYWWPGMTKDVEQYVQACQLCVRTKAHRTAPPGFLQPLPVPFRAWSDISADYITPLPECDRGGKKYKHVVVIVCRLTKMRHFIPTEGLTAEELAKVFIDRIYCLHGTPDNVISDRGTQFVSEFWRHLSERLKIQLRHSSAFHPETDGQTERVNAVAEQYLRAFMNFHQDDWVDWLPLAEFASNNTVSETTGVSPFFANYGFHPRMGIEPTQPCPPNLSPAQKKEFLKANSIADRFERILTQLKALSQQAAQRYEDNANKSREDAPVYAEGQEVYVSTKNMKTNRPMKKGDDKWAGPYRIIKVYRRACLLQLPEEMKIFPVFHNSLLRAKPPGPGLPGQDRINEAESKNIRGRILERDDETNEVTEKWEFDGLLDCHDEDGLHYLVKWRHHKPTWQPASDLKGQDEVLLEFHRNNPDKPKAPRWVKQPLGQAVENDSQKGDRTQEEPLRRKRGRPRKIRLMGNKLWDSRAERGNPREQRNFDRSRTNDFGGGGYCHSTICGHGPCTNGTCYVTCIPTVYTQRPRASR